ncbi:MAG: ribosome biogenesis GTP-binding protein YihA/YsxC [bacterium]
MKILSVEFVKSVQDVKEIPRDGLAEIAFSGRSNVGKSRLINCLLNRKKMAKTSSTPGKTRQINYFRINGAFFFVDLPGYGFARVSKSEKVLWQRLIESYIKQSRQLKGVVAIIDSRIGPTPLDLQLFGWLSSLKVPMTVVATKSDKLSNNALNQRLAQYSKQLQASIYPFSAVSGMGKRALWKEILTTLEL